MDKKEIYEHLAKIYLDASSKSSKKKRRNRARYWILNNLPVIGLIFTFTCASAFLVYNLDKYAKTKPQVALYLIQDAAKINFNFNPAKKETLALNLNGLNLNKYKKLSFDLRKINSRDHITLRVELANRFNEVSEIYIRDIPQKWSNYTFELNRFKGIGDWRSMKSLVFCVEEWNSREKSGIIYIDNVRLIK